ncbi:MAG TPA: SAVED domain-containing protein [Burkholderiaceae bacterium]|nr:SAVED domain-containing protein [Burkholderiaceae bacterium]
MIDDALAHWLSERQAAGPTVFLVAAGHWCAVFDENDRTLRPVDPNEDGIATLRALAAARRLRHVTLQADAASSVAHAPGDWLTTATAMTVKDLKTWQKSREDLFDEGRGKRLTDRAIRLIWHEAGGRCMFEGCGLDLGHTPLTTKLSQTAYLAHIIAADKDGPRGNPEYSFQLSDDPENIMLMCDAHHRLIDRIDVESFPATRLQTMRARHVAFIRQQLDALAYPRTQGIAFLGNIAGTPSAPSERDMRNAMLDAQLSPLPTIAYPLLGTHRDDRLPATFWRHLLREHSPDLRELVRRFDGSHPTSERHDVLSVFPLTAVPLLVLCGRIVGEARPVKVFQFDPERASFCWDPQRTPQPVGGFFLQSPSDTSACAEVLLTIELTAEPDLAALPADLAQGLAAGSVRHVRLRTNSPNGRCIGHPDDLAQFSKIAREALALIQDTLRAQRIHLIGVSPASTLFRYGQLLRPGHHCTHVLYDRADRTRPFRPALVLTGQEVTDALPPDNECSTLTLR